MTASGHKQTTPMWLDRDPQQRSCGLGQWSTLKATRQIAAVDPVPPVGFGAIERAIGFRQQKIQIAGVAIRRCDANAHRHGERATCSSMCSHLECLANSVCNPHGLLVRDAWEQASKFLAAHPSKQIRGS